MLRYRPHRRCLLRYVLESPMGQGPTEVIGKVYAQRPIAEQVWQALKSLHIQGKAGGVIIPQPLVVKKGVPLFQSIALVRMAVRSFHQFPGSYAREGADSLPVLLLQEAAACLAEL